LTTLDIGQSTPPPSKEGLWRQRLSIRKLREILRLYLELGMRARAITRSCSLSPSTVSGYLGRVKVAKLSWPLPPELDEDVALTRLLFSTEGHPMRNRPEPDWTRMHLELRKKHVTKQLL
jgi:hypothetical protein